MTQFCVACMIHNLMSGWLYDLYPNVAGGGGGGGGV